MNMKKRLSLAVTLLFAWALVQLSDFFLAIIMGEFDLEDKIAAVIVAAVSLWHALDRFPSRADGLEREVSGFIGVMAFMEAKERSQHFLFALKEQARRVVRADADVSAMKAEGDPKRSAGKRSAGELKSYRLELENYRALVSAGERLAKQFKDVDITAHLSLDLRQLASLE